MYIEMIFIKIEYLSKFDLHSIKWLEEWEKNESFMFNDINQTVTVRIECIENVMSY